MGRIMNDFIKTHRIEPGQSVDLDQIETRSKGEFQSKSEGRERLAELTESLREVQYRLHAEQRQSLLVVLQAPDAAGKDGTIRKVFGPLNPQGVKTHPFKVPTPIERRHDFLWRVHSKTPAAGEIAVFNRSHYEDVLVVRVKDLVPRSIWEPRYEHINAFEKLLVDSGTRVLKFYLHVSFEEQLERFGKRLSNPAKHWKLNDADYEAREAWSDYRAAYQDMIKRCNSDDSPWHVIPADRKWYRDVAVAEIVLATLREMDPQYPPVEADLDRYAELFEAAGGSL